MFRITVEGETLQDLAGNLQRIALHFQTTAAEGTPAPKASRRRAAPTAPETEVMDDEDLSQEDAAIEADLQAEVEPMPETGKTIVDAGTGQPAEPIKMTMDDVKTAAAELAAKDTPALAKLLKKYGAGKLSEVPKAKLGDFAADVMEALG